MPDISSRSIPVQSLSEGTDDHLERARLFKTTGDVESAYQSFSSAFESNCLRPVTVYKEFHQVTVLAGRLSPSSSWVSLVPETVLEQGSFLNEIIKALNERKLYLLNAETVPFPEEIDPLLTTLFFAKADTQLRRMFLENLSDEDQETFIANGISLPNLRLNQEYHVKSDGIGEAKGRHPYAIREDCEAGTVLERARSYVSYQILALKERCIHAICPFSGKVLCSNKSFFTPTCIFYRFVSTEVFYLAASPERVEKQYFYFPKSNIAVSISR